MFMNDKLKAILLILKCFKYSLQSLKSNVKKLSLLNGVV